LSHRTSVRFHLIDVFTDEPLTGNPLALVEDGPELTLDLLQRIAREFNQSETTFLFPPSRRDADWRLRSFSSAGVEVFGAGGHNTLGAWWWLAEAGKLSLNGEVTIFSQEIGDRVLPVTVVETDGELDYVEMDQDAPTTGDRVTELDRLAVSLGIGAASIVEDRAPCQVVSTGVPHLMVPIRDRETIDRVQPDAKTLATILEKAGAEGCYVFSLDPRESDAIAYTRFFGPRIGIPEDPATGTAAGPLAFHLVANGVATRGRMRIEQGTAMGRTSLIDVEVTDEGVKLSARAVVVGSGRLMV
jgi:trans-2,3-dihydro-3-hydroxyanthranilate isomerase